MTSSVYGAYLHCRPDGTPFYVGKGSGRRAQSSTGRNSWWENITTKYGFDVEIVADNLSEMTAFNLEKDLISLFRKLKYNISHRFCRIRR